jgi:Heterokaryon incompatibility protein Het-C
MKPNLCVCQILLISTLSFVCSLSLAANTAKPAAPVDDWKGTNFNTAHSASVATEKPFDPTVHEAMTPAGSVCSEQLNAAIYRQDMLHAFESNAHYDNCAFETTYEYIQSMLKQSDAHFRRAPDNWNDKTTVPQPILDGMLALGQILHSVQDFYAHSNYVELIQKINPVPEREQDIPVMINWTKEGHTKIQDYIKKGLVSGRVWWTFPHHCANTGPTHADLAKDSATTNAGAKLSVWKRAAGNEKQKNYNVAYNLAHRGTREFLQWSGEQWPQIEKHCGKTLKYIITEDKRQADLPETSP